MKKIYKAPELEIKSFRLVDVILTSTESSIGGYDDITPGGGGGGASSDFDDNLG